MLTSLFIDNYRCFENFTLELGPKALLLGRNGSGKSSVLDVLNILQRFATEGASLGDVLGAATLTRWNTSMCQTFAVEVKSDEGLYKYTLKVEHGSGRGYPAVKSERLTCDSKPVVTVESGIARIFDKDGTEKPSMQIPKHRSLVDAYVNIGGNQHWFKRWLSDLHGTRIDPKRMGARSERECTRLTYDCSNYADWYRHFVQEDPRENENLCKRLTESMEGFDRLVSREAGQGVRVLMTEFRSPGSIDELSFRELSDGQRVLVALYTLLLIGVRDGRTLIIDEPDNFVSLPEIQPWLLELLDRVDEGKGQAILISHHPELLNQMAVDCGIVFGRDGAGPVRVKPYEPSGAGAITAAEDVARGWFDE